MTQLFTPEGVVVPVTVVSATPNTVTRIKTGERDGYEAVQVGFETQKPSRLSKAVLGALGGQAFKEIEEFRIESPSMAPGELITVSQFQMGDKVAVTGISKGKGFQGVVKRHGFSGGPRTHGQKHSEREPGSIGGGLRTRVPKGMRMAGRTGTATVTVRNLVVAAVDADEHKLYIRGAVPGHRGSLVRVVGMSEGQPAL